MITFEVPGLPVAQPRQRHAMRRTKTGKFMVVNYIAEKDPINAFKAAVGLVAKQHIRTPITGPVRVELEFYFPRPKALIYKNKPMIRAWKTSKPDLDNLEKSTWDAMNGIAWHDDAQVCESVKRKVICSGSESARVIISIGPITEGPA